jgi:hypothetical protein
LEAFFASGRAIDLVLLVLLAEALWLRWRGRAPLPDILRALLPGAFLLLAVRAALTGAPWPLIALPLILSLPAHLADIRRRRW